MKQTTRIIILACLVLTVYLTEAVAICFKEELFCCCTRLRWGLVMIPCVLEIVLIAVLIKTILKNKAERDIDDVSILGGLIIVNSAAALVTYQFLS